MAGYSGTPLPKKLGLSSGQRLALVDPPESLNALLGGAIEAPNGSGAGGGVRDTTVYSSWGRFAWH
jgi:hypothetical protein